MLLILLSWIYIFITLSIFGSAISEVFNFRKLQPAFILVIGFFGITLSATVFSFFFRINWEFHLLLLVTNFFLFFGFTKRIKTFYSDFFISLKLLSTFLKTILSITLLLILAQCATAPYVIDNESYYIQTIKWLNEYGLVPGLANLHFFLGQTSGWHITQAVFNFSFLFDRFNDLSGFCLLLGNYFAFTRLQQFFQIKKNRIFLAAGLFPLGNILFFQFISAPSPDIPVIVFSFMLFFYIIEHYENIRKEEILLITFICLFIVFIKTTAVAVILLPPALLILNWKNTSHQLFSIIGFSFLVMVLFVFKNSIITGYPLFPTNLFDILSVDWKIPAELQEYYYQQTKVYAYLIDLNQFEQMSVIERFFHWLMLPKLHGIFNKLILLVIFISIFFIRKSEKRKSLSLFYILALLQLGILFFTSPQYRFFLPFLVFFGCFITACILQKFSPNLIKSILVISLFLVAIPLFFPISLNKFSDNKFALTLSTFNVEEIFQPHENSRYLTDFELIREDNMEYYSPRNIDFFWAAGNGPLPCVNKDQIDYFKKYFNVVPQLRTQHLDDGFYSKTIKE